MNDEFLQTQPGSQMEWEGNWKPRKWYSPFRSLARWLSQPTNLLKIRSLITVAIIAALVSKRFGMRQEDL
jgi:hypothetical protein